MGGRRTGAKRLKSHLKFFVLLGHTMTPLTGMAVAQQPSLEILLVETQKRPRALATVPIAATVFTADDLQSRGTLELRDVLERAPNVGINKGTGRDSTQISIRGIGTLGGELQSVGIYLDGFELRSPAGRVFDIERVEVLRGPQGTAFGRNVTAGAINQAVADADPTAIGAKLQATGGNFEFFDIEGSLNIPISETTAARVSGYYNRGDAHINNLALTGQQSRFEDYAIRAVLSAEPNNSLNLRVIASHEALDDRLADFIPDGVLTGSVPLLKNIIDNGVGLFTPGTLPAGPASFFPTQNRFTSTDAANTLELATTRISTNITRKFDVFELDILAGYSREDRDQQLDLDVSAFDVAVQRQERLQEFWSTELRLLFAPEGWGNWVSGLYYGHERTQTELDQSTGLEAAQISFLPALVTGAPFDFSLLPNETRFFGGSYIETLRSFAVYALGEFQFGNRLTLSAGLRLGSDLVIESIASAVDLASLPGGLLQITALPDARERVTTTKLTGNVGLFYTLSDSVALYSSFASGYRTGGLQLNNVVASRYGDEGVQTLALGLKLTLFEQRLRVDANGFFSRWRDIQLVTFNRTNNQSFTDNAARAMAYGFELDAHAQLTSAIRVTMGVGFTESRLSGFAEPNDPREGFNLPNAPRWQVVVGAFAEQPIGLTTKAYVQVDYLFNGEQTAFLPAPGLDNPIRLERWHRVDVRAGINIASVWRLEAYANNVLDRIYADGATVSGISLAGSGFSSPRRVYGFRVAYNGS